MTITGKWVYRSFLNDPTLVRQNFVPSDSDDAQRALSLLWGEGMADFAEGDDGKVAGTLEFRPGAGLDLSGQVALDATGEPSSLNVRAVGRAGTPTAGWTTTIQGWFVPTLQDGQGQRPSVVGAVVSTGHGPVQIEKQPLGTVGSFVLVRSA